MSNPTALGLQHPLDMDDARRAAQRMTVLRREAENTYRTLVEDAAEAEADYRKGYAKAFLTAEGTGLIKEQTAREKTADLAARRDITEGLVKAQSERLRGLEGERSLLKSLIDWSARMEVAA